MLNRAVQLRSEQDKALADYTAHQTAAKTVPGIAKAMTSLVRALARAMS